MASNNRTSQRYQSHRPDETVNDRPGNLRHIGAPHSTSKNSKGDVKSYVNMQLKSYLKKYPELRKSAKGPICGYIFENRAASAQKWSDILQRNGISQQNCEEMSELVELLRLRHAQYVNGDHILRTHTIIYGGRVETGRYIVSGCGSYRSAVPAPAEAVYLPAESVDSTCDRSAGAGTADVVSLPAESMDCTRDRSAVPASAEAVSLPAESVDSTCDRSAVPASAEVVSLPAESIDSTCDRSAVPAPAQVSLCFAQTGFHEQLIVEIFAYCPVYSFISLYGVDKRFQACVVASLKRRSGIFQEKSKLPHTLSFLQLWMLPVLSTFMEENKELCCEEVKMQKKYDSDNPVYDVYSHYHWEQYESDDEESAFDENEYQPEKVVATVPVDYVSFVYGLVVAWPSMSKQHGFKCPCNPLFQWDHELLSSPRGVASDYVGDDQYGWECKLRPWHCFLADEVDCYKKNKTFRDAAHYLSHCCDLGGVTFTPDGIEFVRHNGPDRKVCKFTAAQWLHIVAGLHHSLTGFDKRYEFSSNRTGCVSAHTKYELDFVKSDFYGVRPKEYVFEMRMAYHKQVDENYVENMARKGRERNSVRGSIHYLRSFGN